MSLEINRGQSLQPIVITRFWHRRVTEATIFVALLILTLYVLPMLLIPGLDDVTALIDTPSAILAGSTLLISVVAYFWTPKRHLSRLTFFVYVLAVATTASLVISSGGIHSPFIALWIVCSVFGGVFGVKGLILLFLLPVGYGVYQYAQGTDTTSLLFIALAGISPVVASLIIWHSKSTRDTEAEKAYSQLANELSHEANKSDTVINAISDGVVSIDRTGIIQLINPAAQRLVGWGQSDAVGLSYKSVVKLLDKSDKPVAGNVDPVERVLATNQQVHSEDFSIQTEAGKKILLSLIVSPIGAMGSGAIMVFRDMTQEKAEERQQAEFISTASHEMRTPVASIEGYLGLVLNPATATIDDKAREYILKAQASAQHLGRLFQDLLDVSKADDGRITNTPSVVDMIEFTGEIAEGLRQKAESKGLRFLFKPRPDGDNEQSERMLAPVFYAHVDNDHLREVLANLIENAIKYTLTGDVTIDVGGDDTSVWVSVRDSGIGIPTEDIPHLFQKFYRVDSTDTREIGGTGLGLYLCRRLTEIMGGQISVESEYKKGSTFKLTLPRIDSQEAQKLIDEAAANKAAEEEPTPIHNVQHVSAEMPKESSLPKPNDFHPNIPLHQIEHNPTLFTSGRPPLKVPVRGPEKDET